GGVREAARRTGEATASLGPREPHRQRTGHREDELPVPLPGAVKMRGVSFDLFHNVGCIFSFLDVFQSLFAFMAVERTPEHCAKRLSAATAAAAEVGPRHQMAASGIGRDEARDGLTSIDLQAALRMELRRWPEAPGGSVAAA
ncbi:unnamed protein product, partial [Prorocentrum cordatum]